MATNPWDACLKLRLTRIDPLSSEACELEPGVNFFVLMLEHMGAVTMYSCEGHPRGFYIMFHGTYDLAIRAAQCGYFMVEGEDRQNVFVLRWRGLDAKGEVVTDKQGTPHGDAVGRRRLGESVRETAEGVLWEARARRWTGPSSCASYPGLRS